VLALSGVFSSGTPRRAATSPTTTHAGTTTRSTTTAQTPATPLPAPAGPLQPGDQGTEVKVLQRALASLGYSTGAADGVYGPATKSAVEAFQKAAKLTADGILGPQTLAALKNALKGP
jgi:peptidoglycan hydrolase-like protein with peptidoglycan-binding domain